MPSRAVPSFSRLFGVLLVAVLGILSSEVLAVWEDVLPGGAAPRKVAVAAVAAVAIGGAGWAVRAYAAGGRSRRARMMRVAAGVALFLALFWAAGVALLWLIWPH